MKVTLPNVRKILIPDPGYTIFEADLAGADAQVVAWEADDVDLKAAFRARIDVHSKNAEDMLGNAFTRLQGASREAARQANKRAVHATNYGGSAKTLATTLNWTVKEAETFQRRWLSLHPRIKTEFQGGIERALQRNRTITNPYGFRRVFFDRIDSCYTEALAWVPQSTVAITTYLGAFQLEKSFPKVEILLQIHDSLVFQFRNNAIPPPNAIVAALLVETPYPDPLFIPWSLSSSTKSWGDCEKIKM